MSPLQKATPVTTGKEKRKEKIKINKNITLKKNIYRCSEPALVTECFDGEKEKKKRRGKGLSSSGTNVMWLGGA